MDVIEQDKYSWEKNLLKFNHSIFMCPDWIEAMSDAWKIPFFIDFVEGGETQGKLSGLIVNNTGWQGTMLFAYAGPALIEPQKSTLNKCLIALRHFATSHKLNRIIIASYDQPYNISTSAKGFYATSRYEFDLNINSESTNNYSGRYIKNLKKARKSNAFSTFHSGSEESIRDLIALLQKTRSIRTSKARNSYDPLFLPHLTKKSLNKLIQKPLTNIQHININGITVCVGIELKYKKKSTILLVGMIGDGYKKGLSALLFDSFIRQAQEESIININLGGIPTGQDGKNLAIFKESIGARKRMVHGATTNFLTYPHKLLNPLMKLGRFLQKNKIFLFITKIID